MTGKYKYWKLCISTAENVTYAQPNLSFVVMWLAARCVGQGVAGQVAISPSLANAFCACRYGLFGDHLRI
jgi:hypothetical protein